MRFLATFCLLDILDNICSILAGKHASLNIGSVLVQKEIQRHLVNNRYVDCAVFCVWVAAAVCGMPAQSS